MHCGSTFNAAFAGVTACMLQPLLPLSSPPPLSALCAPAQSRRLLLLFVVSAGALDQHPALRGEPALLLVESCCNWATCALLRVHFSCAGWYCHACHQYYPPENAATPLLSSSGVLRERTGAFSLPPCCTQLAGEGGVRSC